jgi:hypothetical protein
MLYTIIFVFDFLTCAICRRRYCRLAFAPAGDFD